MLRSARLSANYVPAMTNNRQRGRNLGVRRQSGRSSRTSASSDVYSETTKDVMQLSMPAFRCGQDVLLFDEKRRQGVRTHRSISMRETEYDQERYRHLYEDQERDHRMRQMRTGGYENPYGYNPYAGNMLNKRLSKAYDPSDLDLYGLKNGDARRKQQLIKRASVLSGGGGGRKGNSIVDNAPRDTTADDLNEIEEVYNIQDKRYNYPYDAPYSNQGPYSHQGYGHGYGGYRGDDYNPYSYRDDGNILPKLNDNWYPGNHRSPAPLS